MSWWDGLVGYQIYVRSFADGNGDGLGDLHGVARRVRYLADLGVGLVWLTPCYPSPGADHGYDVADYCDVATEFGGMSALDAVVETAHDVGLRVVMDLVPNHSSDQHDWFQAALADPADPHRDYYVFRDPAPDGGPPNNWVSHFGGPAWTLDQASGQYYLHLFLPEQPDLNWANPVVQDEFDQILRFWFERGIDGFRIDVAHALVKDHEFRDNPVTDSATLTDPVARRSFEGLRHVHDLDQPGVVDIYRSWRAIADSYDALLLGEVYLLEPARMTRYVADDALHAAFCFPALRTTWDVASIRNTLIEALDASAGRFAWPMSSHDDPRAATRFGGGRQGAERALAYFTLLAGLPGLPFLYQGDELGLDDASLSPADFQDPASRGRPVTWSRDAVRTPMPWTDQPGRGFSDATPWLPITHGPEWSAAVQQIDAGSILQRYRELLAGREVWLPTGLDVTWLEEEGDVVGYRRGAIVAAANTGTTPAVLPLPANGTLRFASGSGVVIRDATLTLAPDRAAIVSVEA